MTAPRAIGPLAADERAAAIALWTACGLTRPWNDPHADLARAEAAADAAVLGGREDGRLVATVMVGWDGHRGWVYYLAVAPDRSRTGWGRAMMRTAEDWLAARGAPRLNLMVRADNAAASRFYAALGYAQSDVIVWQRPLG